jgi:peptide methionine sulfoxide reductase msrA/msrB
MVAKITRTAKEWKEILTPEQYRVLRQAGTERPFSGRHTDHKEKGIYLCAACGTPLFSSETKYDHDTGWPSFSAPLADDRLEYHDDDTHGMHRIEVRCTACGSHLGHVFDDGPAPTYQHFCINSTALNFRPAQSDEESLSRNSPSKKMPDQKQNQETATFAAGCFWGVEDKFRRVKGVVSTRVGYSGGLVKNPNYDLVCSDTTGHAESVEVLFNPAAVSYAQLLEFFFLFHDPTQVNRQGPDSGSQYRSVIFYHDERQKKAAQKMIESLNRSGRYERPIATQLLPASKFFKAEAYHQQYYEKFRDGK